jgi:hypothetical protein
MAAQMATWQQFTLRSVQAAMFTGGSSEFTTSRVLSTILREFAERFTGEIQALPLPPSYPRELPRVMLQSNDGSWQMSASLCSLSCTWLQKDPAVSVQRDNRISECAKVLEQYVSENKVLVGRLGLVLQNAYPTEAPALTLIRRFCTEQSQIEPFNRSENFEIHNHKVYTPAGVDYPVNSWVRCQSGVLEPEKASAILVLQDLNTVAEDLAQDRFDAEKVHTFFSVATAESGSILKKYFPGE